MKSPAYRPDIDGLRALAILSVVAFHAFPTWFPGGYVGVDVFFVISGYLITRIIVGNLAAGTFSFAEFYARRVRRIFPALVLVLACAYALGGLVLGPEDFRQLSKHALAGASFTSNFLLWQEAGYFDAATDTKPFLHLWSIAIEEQFYLTWPLLAWLAWRRGINVYLLALAIGAASFLWNLGSVVAEPEAAFYSPATRAWELMMGCALAARENSVAMAPLGRRQANATAAAGILLIAAAWCLVSRESVFPGAWALLPTLGAVLLLRSGRDAWINRRIFARQPLVYLGLISYALYLWHWPLLAYLNVLHPEGPPAMLRLAAILLALILAWLTYRAIERKVRSFSGWAGVPLLVGLSALTALTAIAGYKAELSPDEALEAQLRGALAWPASHDADRYCREIHPLAYYCTIARPGTAATHALIGDSHANHFYPGLAAEIGKSGGNLVQFGGAGCVPLAGVDSSAGTNCQSVIGTALDLVLADNRIHTVILAANWHLYAQGTRFSSYRNRRSAHVKLATASAKDAVGAVHFEQTLSRTIALLTNAGKRVVILKQVPELETRFENCLAWLRATDPMAWDRVCAVAREKVDRYIGAYAGMVDAAAAGNANVTVLDPVTVLCDKDLCYAAIRGGLLYRDDLHLGAAGSAYVAGRLWPKVSAAAAK
jgi:peptidoglycan/LPS O-acetylase OafA/YrhL